MWRLRRCWYEVGQRLKEEGGKNAGGAGGGGGRGLEPTGRLGIVHHVRGLGDALLWACSRWGGARSAFVSWRGALLPSSRCQTQVPATGTPTSRGDVNEGVQVLCVEDARSKAQYTVAGGGGRGRPCRRRQSTQTT